MFHLESSILRVLKLVLGISFKLIPDTFYKGSGIATIFLEISFEFFLRYKNIRLLFLSMPVFILCSANDDTILKKKSSKWVVIVSISSSRIEIILILLAKPVEI